MVSPLLVYRSKVALTPTPLPACPSKYPMVEAPIFLRPGPFSRVAGVAAVSLRETSSVISKRARRTLPYSPHGLTGGFLQEELV